jgi:hypothetical protein
MVTRTKKQAIAWANAQINTNLSWGGFTQCVAFSRNYVNFLCGSQFGGVNSAKDMVNVAWPIGFSRSSTPQVGDIAVLGPISTNPDGHTNVVVEVGNGYILTLDQNYRGKNSKIEQIRWVWPNSRYIGFFRPQFVPEAKPTNSVPSTVGSAGKTLYLKPYVEAWNVYQEGSRRPRTPIGVLRPKKYGGLQYRIIKEDVESQTVVIQTQTYGRVAIFVDKDAEIR